MSKVSGTIQSHPNFCAEDAAKKLRKAMENLGTDEDTIIAISSTHDAKQRKEIAVKYKTLFGRDLIEDLKSELSFNFKTIVVGIFTDHVEFDAESCYYAMKGLGTNERILVDFICTKSNSEIAALKLKYKALFGSDLERDVAGETSGYFNRVLVAMLAGGRDEEETVDTAQAKKDAEAFYNAGEKKFGTDEVVFNQILASRSRSHLRAMFATYKTLAGKDITDSIRSETSGDYQTALLALALSASNLPAYYAERLHNTMKGIGTNDAELTRICVARCEIDMANIREEFHRMYDQTLMDFIRGDTSGDYQKMLLAIVGSATA